MLASWWRTNRKSHRKQEMRLLMAPLCRPISPGCCCCWRRSCCSWWSWCCCHLEAFYGRLRWAGLWSRRGSCPDPWPSTTVCTAQETRQKQRHTPLTDHIAQPRFGGESIKPFEHWKWNSDHSRSHLTHHKHHSEPLLFLTSEFSCGSLTLHRKKTEAADWLEITVKNIMFETPVASCSQQKMKQRKDGWHTSSGY